MNEKAFVKARKHYKLTPAESLKMLRELQGLSQADLAEHTGIAQSACRACN